MKAKLNNPTFHKPINECQHLAAYNFKSLPGNMIINQTCEHLILPLWTNTKEKKTPLCCYALQSCQTLRSYMLATLLIREHWTYTDISAWNLLISI